jgi:uncharacterized protein (TIGR00255 family)
MLKSMTAYGRAVQKCEDRDVTVEIRSVNSRYFDCTVRLPRGYLHMEEKIKSFVQNNVISRGKVEIFVNVEKHTAGVAQVSVDLEYARAYVDALRRLKDELGLKDDITVMSVARQTDIFRRERAAEDLDKAWEWLCPVLDEALVGYVEMRTREGERIERDIMAKVENVRAFTDEVEKISHEDTVGYRDKLEARLRAILADNAVTVDENRLLTECAVWADKIAIDEELVRLRSHFGAFYEIAGGKEPSGRKLDFLMQEMNRETNTIGSKANNARIARIVVNIKGELEKIREQVQNIE